MAEWQPIKTAPKDGTTVLTYPHYRTTHWVTHSMIKPYWAGAWDDGLDEFSRLRPDPTHWQPLPEPPNVR